MDVTVERMAACDALEHADKAAANRDQSVLRYGQAWFNALHDVRPDLADQIRGTDVDPFFDNSKVKFAQAHVGWVACHEEAL